VPAGWRCSDAEPTATAARVGSASEIPELSGPAAAQPRAAAPPCMAAAAATARMERASARAGLLRPTSLHGRTLLRRVRGGLRIGQRLLRSQHLPGRSLLRQRLRDLCGRGRLLRRVRLHGRDML
jgi:hypothetical protein